MNKIKRMMLKKFSFGIAQHQNWFKHLKPMIMPPMEALMV